MRFLGGTVAAALLCAASVQAGTMINSFETAPTGWTLSSGSNAVVTVAQSTTGVTDGSYSVQVIKTPTATSGYSYFKFGGVSAAQYAAMVNDGKVSIDYQYDAASTFGGWLQMGFLIQTASGYNSNTAFVNIPVGSPNTEMTATFDLSTLPAGVPAAGSEGTWRMAEVIINGAKTTSGAGTQTFYFDNLATVVPEPATLGLLALTSTSLLRRRRAR